MQEHAIVTADLQYIPRHIAIIMDGNGRWAGQQNLPRFVGHRAGTRHIHELVAECIRLGVQYLTLYAFSTENWNRPRYEVEGMIHVLTRFIDTGVHRLHEMGIHLRHLGHQEWIDEEVLCKIRYALDLTRSNTRLTLAIAFNYGGRGDIVDAVQAMVADGIPPHTITEHTVASYLSTTGLPAPDLVIRTSGEQRISNFLLWETAYSVYWSTPTFWPDFRAEHLQQIILEYAARQMYVYHM